MSLREEQCKNVCRILDNVLANRPTERDSLILAVRKAFAEPQIVHCRDCKNLEIDSIFHDCWCNGHKVWLDHYCGYAERRTDEEVQDNS